MNKFLIIFFKKITCEGRRLLLWQRTRLKLRNPSLKTQVCTSKCFRLPRTGILWAKKKIVCLILFFTNGAGRYANEAIERGVDLMKRVIVGGRMLRDQNFLPTKNPLYEVVVLTKDPAALSELEALEGYIKLELNVGVVTLISSPGSLNVKLHATPDFRTLGTRLKNDLKVRVCLVEFL
jgi:hypothetical protein